MKRSATLLFFAMLMVVLGGCPASRLSMIDVEKATPQDGWEGVNNLSRDNLFYFAGQPDEASFERLAEEADVQMVINLRPPQELENLGFDEPAVIDKLGVRHINIPITPDSFSKKDVDRLAEILGETAAIHPILIHCSSGNRVGGLWAAYLVHHRGFDLEEALDYGRAAGLSKEAMIEAVRRVAAE